jgi:hypothetical protein
MSDESNNGGGGRFEPGKSGNPKGRPRKTANVDTAILNAIGKTVIMTQNGRRKRIRKVDVAVTQLVNKSASGDLPATKFALGLAQKAHDRAAEAGPPRVMTVSDQEIAARVVERLTQIIEARLTGATTVAGQASGGTDANPA